MAKLVIKMPSIKKQYSTYKPQLKIACIGFLVGLVLPILAILLLYLEGISTGIWEMHKTNKLLWIIYLTPFILGYIFVFFRTQQIHLQKSQAKEEKARDELEQTYIAQKETLNLLAEKTFAFRETNAQLKSIRDALNRSVIVSVTNIKGEIIEVNSMFCKVSGYSEEELLGQDHRLVNSGHHPRKFWRKMWADLKKGHSWRAEVCNRKKNGELYWVDSVMNPVYNEDRKLHRILSIRYLITDRKHMEGKNRRQQIMLQEAESLTQIGAWRYDLNSGEFHTSAGLRRMLWPNKNRSIELGDFFELAIPEDQEKLQFGLERAVQGLADTYALG